MRRRSYISQHPDPFGLTRGTEGAVRRIEEPKPKPRELTPEEEFSALWRGVDDAAYAGGYDIKPYSKELETELRRRQQEEGLTAAGLKDSGQAMVLAREFSRQEREMQAEIERIKFEKAIQGHNLRFLTDAEKRNLEKVARANLGLPAEETELIKKEDSEIKMEEIPIAEPSQSSGQKEGLRRAAIREQENFVSLEVTPKELSDQGWVEEVGKYLRVNGRTEEFSGFEPYALRAVRYLRDQGIDLNRLSAERQMVYVEKGIPNLMRSWMRTE